MARFRKNGKRIRNAQGKRIRCEECPCPDGQQVCPTDNPCNVPASFQVVIQGLADNSCADCDTINGSYEVAYQGSIDCGGETHHYWTSAADVFNSSVCSNAFKNRMIVVSFAVSGPDCHAFGWIVEDSDSMCLDSGDLDTTLEAAFLSSALIGEWCASDVTMNPTGIFNAGTPCNVASLQMVLDFA